jgi:hypothetical protein
MPDKSFSNELQRVRARPDAEELQRRVRHYYENYQAGVAEWTDEDGDSLEAIFKACMDNAEDAFAYAVLAMAGYDDEGFLDYAAAGPLEDSLRDPPDDLVERVIAEGRRTHRLRWMLDRTYPHAMRKDVADRIRDELGGWSKDFPLPPRPWA